jgi:hypothetical protein
MPYLLRPLLAVAVLVGVTALALCQGRPADSTYYPLPVGAKWTYQFEGKKLLVQVTRQEPTGSATAALLETFSDGQLLSREEVGVTADGVYRCSIGGERYDPPVCILKLPPQAAAKWTFESKFHGATETGSATQDTAEIAVPAGKYKAVRVHSVYKADGQDFAVTGWYAAGVGLVKQVIKTGAAELTLDLEKFEPAPR